MKAEAAATGGRDEKSLGPMSAVVDGDQVESKTALADFAAPGLISAARANCVSPWMGYAWLAKLVVVHSEIELAS